MLNINSAVRQMRVARKLGKISNETQTRLMRKLAPRDSQLSWESMMRLRAQIERDIRPILQAKREAERDVFNVLFQVESNLKAKSFVSAKVKKKVLAGYEYTPEWWKEAEKRERAQRKAGILDE